MIRVLVGLAESTKNAVCRSEDNARGSTLVLFLLKTMRIWWMGQILKK